MSHDGAHCTPVFTFVDLYLCRSSDRRGQDPYGSTPSIVGVTPTVRPLRSQGSTPTIVGVRPLRYRRGPIEGVDPSYQIGSRLLQAEQSAGDQRRVTSPTREALPPRCTAGRYLFFLSKGVMAAAKPPIGPNTGGLFLPCRNECFGTNSKAAPDCVSQKSVSPESASKTPIRRPAIFSVGVGYALSRLLLRSQN